MSGLLALEVRGLRKSYGDALALESLDLELGAGHILGFLGPNGAGKTTVVRILSTILRPDAGWFAVAGVPNSRPQDIRRRIGVLPESAGYPRGQTGEEWLTYHAQLFGRPRSSARGTARRLLGEVGLAERGRSLISGYSRGMRQRLGIARSLVNDPEVVFLDEPTLGLDPVGQVQMLRLISSIAHEHGATVVLSTHLLGEVENLCDAVLILSRGRVVAQGTVTEVVHRAAAPREALVQVSTHLVERTLRAFSSGAIAAEALANGAQGEVRLIMPAGMSSDVAATSVMACLLNADVPVLSFRLEGGRLSDAFLAVTEVSS